MYGDLMSRKLIEALGSDIVGEVGGSEPIMVAGFEKSFQAFRIFRVKFCEPKIR